MGVRTAADLAALPQRVLRSEFNVVLARTALELGGVSCLTLDATPVETPVERQTLVSKRGGTKCRSARSSTASTSGRAVASSEPTATNPLPRPEGWSDAEWGSFKRRLTITELYVQFDIE